MKTTNKLQRSLITGFFLLVVCLILVISAVAAAQQITAKIKTVERTAFSCTKAAAEYIDGDRIAFYAETGETDEYYDGIQKFLNAYLENSDLLYYYVIIPLEDEVMYIWDAKAGDRAYSPLGSREKYADGEKAEYELVFRRDPVEKITFEKNKTYGYIGTADSPVFDSSGEPVALVGADVYVPELEKEIAVSLLLIIASIIVIVLITELIFFRFVHKRIVTPIYTLNDAAKNVVENLEAENSLKIDISRDNEIGELADSFERMYVGIRDYITRLSSITAEKERIGAELDVAARIQTSMLPCIFPAFPDRSDFEIYAAMKPAKEVGGDFYDFFMVDDENLAITVADVSGKGIPAALFMVIGKTLIKDHTTPGKDLGQVFEEVNKILCESNSEELFITAFVGVLNLRTGSFRYVNAGHETPYIAKKNEKFKPHKVQPAFVLGGMEGIRYKAGELQFEPGDKFFQYTDGVTEATDKDFSLFGKERLEQSLAALSDKGPKEILDGVKADIDAFVSDAPQFDDITMLCLKYNGMRHECRKVDLLPENVELLTDFVESTLRKEGAAGQAITKMNIAVDELFSNIVKFSGASYAEVFCGVEYGYAILRFEDDGVPYNPLEKAEPDITLSAEEREPGGLGILMVKKSMDDMKYEYKDSKNILVLYKKL